MKFGFEGDSIRFVWPTSSELLKIHSFQSIFDGVTSSFWYFWTCSLVFGNDFCTDGVSLYLNIKIEFWKLWDSYDKLEKLLSFHLRFKDFEMVINEKNIFNFLVFGPFSFNYVTNLGVFRLFFATLEIFWMWVTGDILYLGVIGLLNFGFDLLAFRVLH